jgi:hypothetical protein
MWPGIYTAELRVVLRQENLLGHPKEIVSVSNQAPFTVAPRIAGHTILAPNMLVDIGNEINLTDLTESYDSLQMSLDGVVYTETFSNPPSARSEADLGHRLHESCIRKKSRRQEHCLERGESAMIAHCVKQPIGISPKL